MASKYDGWLGPTHVLLEYLESVSADKDEDGPYLVAGHISSFLGMTGPDVDMCVGADAIYFVGGRAVALAPGLRAANEGTGIMVITSLV